MKKHGKVSDLEMRVKLPGADGWAFLFCISTLGPLMSAHVLYVKSLSAQEAALVTMGDLGLYVGLPAAVIMLVVICMCSVYRYVPDDGTYVQHTLRNNDKESENIVEPDGSFWKKIPRFRICYWLTGRMKQYNEMMQIRDHKYEYLYTTQNLNPMLPFTTVPFELKEETFRQLKTLISEHDVDAARERSYFLANLAHALTVTEDPDLYVIGNLTGMF